MTDGIEIYLYLAGIVVVAFSVGIWIGHEIMEADNE